MVIETQLACEWKANMSLHPLNGYGAPGSNFEREGLL
jgi:hypothetical protein